VAEDAIPLDADLDRYMKIARSSNCDSREVLMSAMKKQTGRVPCALTELMSAMTTYFDKTAKDADTRSFGNFQFFAASHGLDLLLPGGLGRQRLKLAMALCPNGFSVNMKGTMLAKFPSTFVKNKFEFDHPGKTLDNQGNVIDRPARVPKNTQQAVQVIQATVAARKKQTSQTPAQTPTNMKTQKQMDFAKEKERKKAEEKETIQKAILARSRQQAEQRQSRHDRRERQQQPR
jgi:hypothetical protein